MFGRGMKREDNESPMNSAGNGKETWAKGNG